MKNYDWSRFIERIPVKAPVQKIYDAWTTQHGLEQWFLRRAEFKKPDGSPVGRNVNITAGDTYEWFWYGYGDGTAERGEVVDANGKDMLKFIFGKAGVVVVNIKQEAGETVVELVQEQIPADEEGKVNYHIGCSTGWTFYLANIKSVLEGGIDLRNRNVNLKNVVS